MYIYTFIYIYKYIYLHLYTYRVAKFLDETEINANKLRDYFKKFEYLWKTDMNVAFETFLATAVTVTWVPYQSDASLPVGTIYLYIYVYILLYIFFHIRYMYIYIYVYIILFDIKLYVHIYSCTMLQM
jgi:hypothetical protein